MTQIQTETKDNGSWSQYLEVGLYVKDAFGDIVFKREGYPRNFPALCIQRKIEGRGAAQHTKWLVDVPADFPWVLRRVTNPGGSDRNRRYDNLYEPCHSLGHFSREDAIAAAEAEFSIVASWRLDARIDAELDRLGWSSRTAPEGNSTLDAWNTATTDQDGIVTLHDDQEVTPFHGLVLLHTLQGLQPAISWDDLWHAILPHMVEE